ncbi:hypothetical protein FOPG_17941 [Fusarium oxysporum f. sp. conglutinans race 2 54008]|uniref:Major facilitator superfamily (MFS) profile domain-containing protein n=1 Tax=Fusarium oxysporum f. sp. conglutinans race 2 54008 TaxID=1089457 RepID=X0HXM1_FUSOX|nr:hypothetical protein FOPG_17941 [Fusarium oxysporum f. sp. conglutinans race 2 54008]
MALIDPDWTYWTAAFFAQVLMPFSIDALFTVGLIVVTETFPEGKQAVAASVFNATSQIGNAMGLAIMQVVTTLVTKKHAGRSQLKKPFSRVTRRASGPCSPS